MTIKLFETSMNATPEFATKANPHAPSEFFEDATEPTGREAFDITIVGTADDRQEVIAFLAQLCELAEDGVVSTRLVGTIAEHAAAVAVSPGGAVEPPRVKRTYTKRAPSEPTAAGEPAPSLPHVPAAPPPPVAPPAPVAQVSHLQGGGAVDTGQALVPPPKAAAPAPETPIQRSREANAPASDNPLSPEELAAYEKANPFTPSVAAVAPPAVSKTNPLRTKVLESKDIRSLLSSLAYDLGERTDTSTGATSGEPTKEKMLAYAESIRAYLPEVAMFKGGFDFNRIAKGVDAIYG